MAKPELRLKIRKLRKDDGLSIKELTELFGVAKSTVSTWCKDIELDQTQIKKLLEKGRMGATLGRLKGAKTQKERKLKLLRRYRMEGIKELEGLTRRESFLVGLGIYWGEGLKKDTRAGFSNSDPNLIKFMLRWFKENFDLTEEDFSCQVGINEIHKLREEKVRKHWVEVTGISLSNFTKTSFKKTHNIKIYENFDNHFGTLRVLIRQPARIYYKIIGLLEGLVQAT